MKLIASTETVEPLVVDYRGAALIEGTSWQQVRDKANAGIYKKRKSGTRGVRLAIAEVREIAKRGLTEKEQQMLADYRNRNRRKSCRESVLIEPPAPLRADRSAR